MGTVTLREDWGPLGAMEDMGDVPPLLPTRALGPVVSSALDTSKIPVWRKIHI